MYIIGAYRKDKLIIDIDTQDLIAKTIYTACVEAGLKKYEIILSTESFTYFSSGKTADEIKEEPYKIKIFEDKENAIKWINE